MSSEDARAVARALTGGMDGYRRLYERCGASVARLVAGFPELEPHEAQAVVEESFAGAFSELANLHEPARFGVWLLGRARQACLVRRAARQGRDPVAPAFDEGLLARDPGGQEQKQALARAALEAVGDEQVRAVAELFFAKAAPTPPQIAATLGLDLASVGRAIERVRIRVKLALAAELLEQRCDSPSGASAEASGEHLGPELWARVLRGERFEGEKALAQHLRAGCAVCEAFLGGCDRADGLDGEADAALHGFSPTRIGRGDEGFARILRRLKLDSRLSGRSGGPERGRGAKALPLGLAGLLVLAGVVTLLVRDAPRSGGDGSSRGPPVGIGFAIAPLQGDGEEEPEEGVSGATYSEEQAVLISYELLSPAFVNVVRIKPDGHVDVLAQPGRIGPGVHDLTVNDVPARVGLRGALGLNGYALPLGAMASASAAPLDVANLVDAIEVVAADGRSGEPLPAQTAAVWFDVVVEP